MDTKCVCVGVGGCGYRSFVWLFDLPVSNNSKIKQEVRGKAKGIWSCSVGTSGRELNSTANFFTVHTWKRVI